MRQRSGTADELNGEEEPEFKAQRPVAHPTKGGIAGTP